jgi:adenosylhomocysteine nucleosidase
MVSRERLCEGGSGGGKVKARVAIVAAMAGELRPLVKGWKREETPEGVTVYTSDEAVATYAGLGSHRARLATEAALRLGPTSRVISAGWAGGLHAEMVPGGVWRVSEIVDPISGEVVETSEANGVKAVGAVLVTTDVVTTVKDKLKLRILYSADLVDMEASAVAEVARRHRISFSAIKAVSDGYDFDLPGMERFTTEDGQFRQVSFAAYAALRPILWKPVARLAKDSSLAARNLGRELERYLAEESKFA